MYAITFQTIERLSPQDFLAFTKLNPGLICELNPNGSITLKRDEYQPAIRKFHLKLCTALTAWSRHSENGFVPDKKTCFVLKTGAVRQPSVAWLKMYKKEQTIENFIEAAPDFIVEFLFSNDNLDALKRKMLEYITAGTSLGWLFDLESERVFIFRATGFHDASGLYEKLTGEGVMEGFIF